MRRIVSALYLVAISAAGSGLGQEPPSEVGVHVVRPGDTLEAITDIYLGQSEAWRENWRLNPGISDPDLLFPGQRVKVLLQQGLPIGTARISALGGGPEEQPTPISWRSAQESDLLRPRDGVRTDNDESTELEFGDGTLLRVGESSLLYLREDTATQARPRPREEIEVVVGVADLRGDEARGQDRDIEIVLGPATSAPAAGEIEMRTKRSEGAGAQVMVYVGAGTVTAAGTAVALAKGEGTAVPESGPPSPPEALLPAPEARLPEADARLDFANPAFVWTAVPGASTYALEICLDPACASLHERVDGLALTQHQAPALPIGTYYWRVHGSSTATLDGFASTPRRLDVLSDRLAAGAPTATLTAEGPQAGLGSLLVLGVGATVTATVTDPTAAGSFEPRLDGEATTFEAWGAGWEPGPHSLEGTAIGGVGERAEVEPLRIISDPIAPGLSWQVDEPEIFEAYGLDQDVEFERPPKRSKGHDGVPLDWSSDGRLWLPVLPKDDERARWRVESDRPQLFLWARERVSLESEGEQIDLEKGQVIRIWSEDEHSAVRALDLRVQEEAGWVIDLSASDLVGNETSRRLALDS